MAAAIAFCPVAAHQLFSPACTVAAEDSSSGVMPLASSVCGPQRPTTVLVHGLDSCRETWAGVLADLTRAGYPAIAVDLRGHGESPMGDPAEFGPESLAADVIAAIEARGIPPPVVLVGHSMGGRVAMQIAATDAERVSADANLKPLLAACVIEDMDCCLRTSSAPDPPDEALTLSQRVSLRQWMSPGGRYFDSWESCRDALLPWNDLERIEGWRGGRIRPVRDGWWSDINPAARRLAQATTLCSLDGKQAWDTLARHGAALQFPVHLWIADEPGTVCAWGGDGGLNDMIATLGGSGAKFRHKTFCGAGHSIHRESREEFVRDLKSIVDGVPSLSSS